MKFKHAPLYVTLMPIIQGKIMKSARLDRNFQSSLRAASNDTLPKAHLSYNALFVLPIQRMASYISATKSLDKYTTAEHIDKKHIHKAFQAMEDAGGVIDRVSKQYKQVLRLEQSLTFNSAKYGAEPLQLAEIGRQTKFQGQVTAFQSQILEFYSITSTPAQISMTIPIILSATM